MPTLKKARTVRPAAAEPQTQSFTLILSAELDDEQAERLYERCEDVTLGVRAGTPYAAFDREAPSIPVAIASAMRDLRAAAPSVQVLRVEPEELVSAAEIARRTGRTRASISQLIEGARGPGSFPAPHSWIGGRPLWQWIDVAAWFAQGQRAPTAEVQNAAFVSALNNALGIRALAPKLTNDIARKTITSVVLEDVRLLEPALADEINRIGSPLQNFPLDSAAGRPARHDVAAHA